MNFLELLQDMAPDGLVQAERESRQWKIRW